MVINKTQKIDNSFRIVKNQIAKLGYVYNYIPPGVFTNLSSCTHLVFNYFIYNQLNSIYTLQNCRHLSSF